MEESKVFENETENTELVEAEVIDLPEVETCEEGGNFKGLALIGAALAGATALGVHAYKKFKSKRADKPRVKKRLRWVEVDPKDVVEVEVDDADEDEDIKETE